MKKLTVLSFMVLIFTTSLLSNARKDLPSKYFSYLYVTGQGCMNLGQGFDNDAHKKGLAEDENIEITKVVEINNDFARILFKNEKGQQGIFIFATSLPVCAGLQAALH